MATTVSILGCGWVGRALKEYLESKQFRVNCLSKNIKQNKIDGFYNCNTLVIALPPSAKDYLATLEQSYLELKNAKTTQIIFLSSTSYYKAKPIVVKAEELIQRVCVDAVILRLGGLMGYDRIAGKYSAGKVITNCNTNYIHRDDVVAIIAKILELKIENKTFDAVAPIQSTKAKVYKQNAKKFGFKEPIFNDYEESIKLNPTKLCKVLDYNFIKPNVLEFW